MRRQHIKWLFWLVLLSVLLFSASVSSLSIGPTPLSFNNIISSLTEKSAKETSIEHTILFNIRLPRLLMAIAVGGSLSIAGVILQGMFKNPLVEPYTLGISGGAALGVALNIVLGLNRFFISYPVSGFLGSITVIFLIYFLSLKKGVVKVQGLLLTGVMISFICSSVIMLIMAVSKAEDLRGIIFWMMGSLGESNWKLITLIFFISVIGLVFSYFFSKDLNAFLLGEEEAVHLGIDTVRIKKMLFIVASVLTGCSVSVAGMIGFVGLVVPHFVRLVIGNDHRILLISSFLTGAIFLIFCDIIARTVISPLELPVGVITGIVGGSIFVYTLWKKEV